MNCLFILLLLACGGCGCGNCRQMMCREECSKEHQRCQGGREREDDSPRRGDDKGRPRYQGSSREDGDDCKRGEPSAWREGREGKRNSYPGISGGETCGCDAE